MPTDPVCSLKSIAHTQVKEVNLSFFQGHAGKISSLKEAASVLQALYQSPQVAKSDHLVYAYSLTDENGMKITGNSDDGEYAASRLIADVIAQEQQSNIIIAISRRHEGPNLGRQRFNIFSSLAKEVLETLTESM